MSYGAARMLRKKSPHLAWSCHLPPKQISKSLPTGQPPRRKAVHVTGGAYLRAIASSFTGGPGRVVESGYFYLDRYLACDPVPI